MKGQTNLILDKFLTAYENKEQIFEKWDFYFKNSFSEILVKFIQKMI